METVARKCKLSCIILGNRAQETKVWLDLKKIFISCLAGICSWGPHGAHAGFNVPNDRAGDPLSKALRIVFPGFGEEFPIVIINTVRGKYKYLSLIHI